MVDMALAVQPTLRNGHVLIYSSLGSAVAVMGLVSGLSRPTLVDGISHNIPIVQQDSPDKEHLNIVFHSDKL